ncbi:type VI secretion system membrane subunit TssM [Uliginosibacterium flavum]|uniref:Type VI secretion system membrane subunit TssM n=1 Tax=Uliginosibacterium flavum TaxID=1396831 RepID=A0ABV2TF80_9RHOO
MKSILKTVFIILGILALVAVIWFVLPLIAFANHEPFDPPWVRLTLIALMLLFFIGRFAWSRWRARRNNTQLLDGLSKSSEPKGMAGHTQTASEAAILHERFQEAMRVLKQSQAAAAAKKGGLSRFLSLGSTRHLYELPWYVFIGAPGSGKTTALVNSGLRFPLAEKLGAQQLKGVGGTRNCDWWFTDDAVLIDTAGRYTTQDSNQSVDREAWQGFVALLRKHRPRQPLNGVLLTVSMGDLLAMNEDQAQRHADVLRARVQELYSDLNVRLPIYLLVTKSDLIAGFNEYFADLGKEARDQVWGVTFPLNQSSEDAMSDIAAKLYALRQRIEGLLIGRLQQETDLTRRGAIAAFDQQFAIATRLLASFAEKVFAPSGFEHPLMVRGVYLTSGTQEGSPIDRVMSSLGGAFGLERRIVPPASGAGKSFFITRLLRDVVFAEQRIGGANLKWEHRRSLARFAVMGGMAMLSLLLLVGWGVSTLRNRSYINEVAAQVQAAQPIVNDARMASPDDLIGILPVIDTVQGVAKTPTTADGVPMGLRFGLFQGDKLDAAADQAYRSLLRDVLYPRIANRIESQLRSVDANNLELSYEALKAYLMLFDAEHFDAEALQAWIGFDWDQNLPGNASPEQRAALARHLAALFADGPVIAPIPQNKDLVANVRNQLLRYPLPDRIFSRLKRQGVGEDVAPFTIEKAVGPTAVTVYARKSGKALSVGVPGLFTFDGYHKAFDKNVASQTKRLIDEEPWVLGISEGQRRLDDSVKIGQEVRRLYLNEYVRIWDAFIDDISVAKAANLQQNIQIARVLSAPDSPMARLMRALSRETTLNKTSNVAVVGKAQEAISETKSQLGKMLFGNAAAPRDAAPGASIESIVDDHFATLRANVGAPDDKSAPLNSAIQLLGDVYAFLSAVETAQRDKVAMPQSDVPNRAKAESARMPEPMRGLLQQLTAAGTGQALSNLRQTLSADVNAQIGQFCSQAIEGRYPFVRSSNRDVTRDDFAALFGTNGKIEDFFNRNLAQFVDTSTKPWSFKRVQEQSLGDPGNLAQFQRAATIRDVFFRSGAALRLDFKPVEMDPAITSFTLDVDGQLIKYSHGPQQLQSVQWPGQRGGLSARVQITPPGPSGASGVTIEGPWALFRIFDKANIEPGSAPEKFRVTFNVDGRTAVFDVTTSSVQNPFRLRELAEFRCPAGL